MKIKNLKRKYVVGWMLVLCIGMFFISGCGGENTTKSEDDTTKKEEDVTKNENDTEEKNEYSWPDSGLANMLPKPESKYGEVIYEAEDDFYMDVYDVGKKDFESYIKQCKDKGFTVDYSKSEDSYYADNDSGYMLILLFNEEKKSFSIDISKPMNDEAENEEQEEKSDDAQKESDEASEPEQPEASEQGQEDTADPEQPEVSEETPADGIRPEIKESIDSYEKFFDEYCEFMTKYSESNNDVSMLADYTKFMAQYAETMGKFEEMADEDLNDAELAYYTEVQLRINQKLSEAALATE